MSGPSPETRVPPAPVRAPGDGQSSRRGSLLPIALAVSIGVLLMGTLTLMSLGFAALVLGVALAVFGLIGVHYIVWGWWLAPIIQGQVEAGEGESP